MNTPRISRRTALGCTAAVAAPLFVSPRALGFEDKPAASERLAIGYIGVGGRGRYEMRDMMRCPKAEHIAVADPIQRNREVAAAMIQGDQHVDFRELLARDDIDAVSIYTPDHWHVPAAILSARAGKAAFVSKPLGLSIEQNIRCREVFREEKVLFAYGTQQRSFPHCHKACEIVRRGLIGEVKRIDVIAPGGGRGGITTPTDPPAGIDYDLWLGPAPVVPYTVDRCKPPGDYWIYDYAIGYLAGWGAHPLDLMIFGSDADQSGLITVEGTGDLPTEGLYDTIATWDMKLMLGDVEMTFKSGRDRTTFVGEEGTVHVWRGGIDADPKSLLDLEIVPDECVLTVSKHHHTNFVESVLSGVEPVAPVEDAVRSDTISHLCDIAVRLDRKLTWDPKKEAFVGDNDGAATKMMHRDMRAPWTIE